MIIPDLNLLIYAYNDGITQHEPARRWWENLLNGTDRVGIPWIVSTGFIRLLTHPRVMTHPASSHHALDIVAEWFSLPNVTALIQQGTI